jgi:hypothetical protein
MPTGLADPLTHQEFLDLMKFLSQLGKPGPYGPSTGQFIRKWQVAEGGSTSSDVPGVSANWATVYSMVSGVLPADATGSQQGRTLFVRGEMDVVSSGKIRLVMNGSKGAKLWVDGKLAEIAPQVEMDLVRGPHVLLFAIDSATRAEAGLSVEVADIPGSTGHGQAGGGR